MTGLGAASLRQRRSLVISGTPTTTSSKRLRALEPRVDRCGGSLIALGAPRTGDRQAHAEGASPRVVVLHPDAAAVDVGGQPAERQSQAMSSPPIPARIRVELQILIEDPVAPVRRDARTQVADPALDETILGPAQVHADRLAFG